LIHKRHIPQRISNYRQRDHAWSDE
jgi:hypothetical protein